MTVASSKKNPCPNHRTSPKKASASTKSRLKGDAKGDVKSVTASSGDTVSSFHSASLRDRIVRFLELHDPVEMQPKIIASRLRTSHTAVKKAIQRELESGNSRIVRIEHGGWYRCTKNIDRVRALNAVTKIEVHGIKLEGMCHSANGGHSIVAQSIQKYRKRGIFKEQFEGRVVTVIVHEMNLVEVFLETSRVPLDFPMFEKFCYWLYGMMNGVVLDSAWKVVQLGLNADAHRLEMSDKQKMSLREWRNAWFQMYQKEKDVVRFETHIMPNLQLSDCLAIMSQFVDWTEKVRRAQTEEKYVPGAPSSGGFDYA